ncbi:hypothetical protein FACS18948_6320 [Clostridia bacterium]|nr:hypothetical protein FACS18948_6320 [Clostridia bacterium]
MFSVVDNIDSFEMLVKVLFDDSKGSIRKDPDRIRSPYAFRGMHDIKYDLVPSLRRNCKDEIWLETNLMRNFARYAASVEPKVTSSVWYNMTIGQHHGLPTRLLDWTYSPLVAMHFATDDPDYLKIDESDAVIWKTHIGEINGLLPPIYQKKLKEQYAYVLTTDLMASITNDLEQYDRDMVDRSIAFMEPPSIDARIVNQYALFSIVPSEIANMEEFFRHNGSKTSKIIIDKSLKKTIRDMLDQMNMTERLLYPGLDGLATWLKRHYCVKA